MSEKTEQPTPKRQRETREKGEICKSQDIPTAATVVGVTAYLLVMGGSIFEELTTIAETPMKFMHEPFDKAIAISSQVILESILNLTIPIVCFVIGVTLVANLAQVGFLFSMKAASPKLENIKPSKWFKKTFSLQNAVEFIKNILKVGILTYAVWYVMEENFALLFKLQTSTIADFWGVLSSITMDLLIITSATFAVIAILDYLFQKWKFNKDHMMTKDEVKREYKDMEGDPLIKGKRKQLHQELLTHNVLSSVRDAKVLVTNPTHYAIAIYYEKDETPLPIILAKGEGYLASRMIEVAKEEKIPIMRNVPLAHDLFENGTVDSYIPRDLIQPVAEVLRWVQSLK